MAPVAVVAVSSAAGPVAAAASVEVAKGGIDPAVVQKMVMETVMNSVGGDEDVEMDASLMDSGMDSLSSVAFRNDLQKAIGFKLPAALIFDYPTMRHVIDHLVEETNLRAA